MQKGIFLAALTAVVFSGCASMTYEARCAMPLEKEPSQTAIKNNTQLIRENFVYTERLYYNSQEWILFADTSGRDMEATIGSAQYVKGQGNFLQDVEFDLSTVEFVDGEFDISQTNPSCYALTEGDATKKGFLATAKQYPFAMKDETEAAWKIDYFDFYHPTRLQNDGPLSLKHKDSTNNPKIAYDDGLYSINGETAVLLPSNKPFVNSLLKVESTGDTYLILGVKRRANDGRYYVIVNDNQMLAMTGPSR